MGDFGIDGSVFGNERAVSIASGFEGFLGFTLDAFGIVFFADFFGAVVTIFLESVKLASETAENADGGGKFVGVGGELFADVWLEEEL